MVTLKTTTKTKTKAKTKTNMVHICTKGLDIIRNPFEQSVPPPTGPCLNNTGVGYKGVL